MRNFPFAQSEALNIVILLCMHHCVILCHGQHYVNLALGKPCKQRSTYSNSIAYSASNAVDNDMITFSHTDGYNNEWWEVDLERYYYVKNILIHIRNGHVSRVTSTTIKVGSTVCASIAETSNTTITTIFVTCQNMIYGRTIRITKDINALDKYINIAEFEVYGCQNNGDTCNQPCLSNCLNNECNQTTGQCRECKGNYKLPQCTGCQQGYYGYTCNQICLTSNCLNNECRRTTGQCTACKGNYKPPQCTGCQQGYYGVTCNQPCQTSNCLNNECDQTSGECTACKKNYKPPQCTECLVGKFGQDCTEICGNCSQGATCDPVNGHCSRCSAGFNLPRCKDKCLVGTFGQDCADTCGNCSQGHTCNPITGRCSRCSAGFNLPLCKEKCPVGTFGQDCADTCGNCSQGHTCDPVTGHCSRCSAGFNLPLCKEKCPVGTFGQDCADTCGNCSQGRTCDPVTGHCSRCSAGFNLPLCKDQCPVGTFGQDCADTCGNCSQGHTCDPVTGHCSRCSAGFNLPLCKERCVSGQFGENCSQKCGKCLDNVPCNISTGHCKQCKPGLQPPLCQEACQHGTYGSDCSKQCGQCKGELPCNATTGECFNGCRPGWTNKTCDQATSADGGNNGAIIGGAVAVIAILIIVVIIIVITFVVLKKRRLHERHEYATVADVPTQDSTRMAMEKTAVISKPTAEVRPQIIDDTIQGAIYENFSEPANDRPRQITNEQIKSDNRENPKSTVGTSKQSPLTAKEKPVVIENMGKPKLWNSNIHKIARKEGIPDGEESLEVEDEYDEEHDDSVYANDATNSKFETVSIPASSLQTYLLETLNSSKLEMEFLKLPPKMIHSHDNGLKAENHYKNRFNSILPYDSTRVVLDRLQNDIASDYINANYIQGHKDKLYIAAQGPKNNTVNDFWRMVWQERVQHIVMLTNVLENTKPKCHEYWPAEGVKLIYGQIEVRGLEEQKRAHYVIRAFEVKNVGSQEKRRVEQFHYVSWFDHDVPRSIDLVDFWRFVKSQASRNLSSPLLVHCSAGVGRTGTYIALDIIMDHADHEKDVNIFGIVRRMRDERCSMVQNKKQYAFLHEVLLEAYTSMKTRLDSILLNTLFSRPINSSSANDRIDKEYEKLKQMQVSLPTPTYTNATQDENRFKNRNPNVLPADTHLVFLPPYIQGRNQYINAVYISTFVGPRGCILTQLPVTDTLMDIWRLIDGCGSTLVVSIKNLHDKEEDACCYWPSEEGETINNGMYTLTMKTKIRLGTSLIIYSVVLQNKQKAREVQIMTYTDWDKEIPANTPELLKMIETLQSCASKETNPVIIQCKDGASKSGLLCALWEIISRMDHTNEIDVYLTVRKVQSVRRQAVNSVVQYRYCYEVVQQYSNRNTDSVYANA